MNNMQPTTPQWICAHCYIHLVNGDCTDVLYAEPDSTEEQCGQNYTVPMSLFGDMYVTSGMPSEEHGEECQEDDRGDEAFECDCETRGFSWSACDGCGSNLGGERHAVTGWIKSN